MGIKRVCSGVFPTFQLREKAFHFRNGLFFGVFYGRIFVELVYKTGAVSNHFIHSAIGSEFSVLVAICTVIVTGVPGFFGPEILFG